MCARKNYGIMILARKAGAELCQAQIKLGSFELRITNYKLTLSDISSGIVVSPFNEREQTKLQNNKCSQKIISMAGI